MNNKHYYRFVSPRDVPMEIKYFCYFVFALFKTKLDVCYKYETSELIPIHFLEPVKPSTTMQTLLTDEDVSEVCDYDFTRTMAIDGIYMAGMQCVLINPNNDPPRLVYIIAHETYHIRQHHNSLKMLRANGMDPNEIKEELSRVNHDKRTEDLPRDVYRNKASEIEAREYADQYASWGNAARYFDAIERRGGNLIDKLNCLDMLAYSYRDIKLKG